MRNWGIVVTAFYMIVVAGLLIPGAYFVAGQLSWGGLAGVYAEWTVWLGVALVVGGQALLLFLSVDASRPRLAPRTRIGATVLTAALLLALLTVAAGWSLRISLYGEGILENSTWPLTPATLFAWWGALWCFWAVVFFLYLKGGPRPVSWLVAWLLRGSVLELLIAIPSHVVVRQRHECCAPVVTGFGIATGLAVMILSFGPSVLFLYRERLNRYSRRARTS